MAFSGFQKTRLGLAAFARSLYGSFAGKEENNKVLKTFGLVGLIDDSGNGDVALIDDSGQGVSSLIVESFGVISLIEDRGQGSESDI
jgi:hypothetical protein